MKGTIWCLHGAVGMAEDWKGFSVPGWAVKRIDLWRFLDCCPMSMAEFVKKVKQSSSVWIKEHGENHSGFSWQGGYGAFSLGASQLSALIAYIDGQEEHHRTRSFQDEYREFLKKYEIEYDERYVWD